MDYVKHLSKDKTLKPAIKALPPFSLNVEKDLFHYLCCSIVSQQLSTQVARVIKQRLIDLYGGENLKPNLILGTSVADLRSIGLSNAKAAYIQNVATFAQEKGMEYKKLGKMDNEEVIAYLTEIKGIGRWTVEMLLMFAMGREDVFAIDDLGIQQGIVQLYGLEPTNKKELLASMRTISAPWAPYRTYACLHIWKWKDSLPKVKNKK